VAGFRSFDAPDVLAKSCEGRAHPKPAWQRQAPLPHARLLIFRQR
jgi:hypothetical protein